MPLQVNLTPPQEAYIAAKVAARHYPNASAVIREALCRMQAAEEAAAERRASADTRRAEWTTTADRPGTLLDLYHALQAGVALDDMSVTLLETEFVGRLPGLLECCCTLDKATPSPQLVAYCANVRDRFGG